MSVVAPRGLMVTTLEGDRPPYVEPFTTSELLTIEAGLQEAWRNVSVCASDDEVRITVKLVEAIVVVLRSRTVAGFDFDTFETPVRGGEVCDYERKQLEKRPDLVFRKVGLAPGVGEKTLWGLFVECKIVDRSHSVANYCRHGVLRFVTGKYAWAVSSAMMLGYCRPGYSLPGTVNAHLRRRLPGVKTTYQAVYDCVGDALVACSDSVSWKSEHQRNWCYPQGGNPGPITVFHLWFKVEEEPAALPSVVGASDSG